MYPAPFRNPPEHLAKEIFAVSPFAPHLMIPAQGGCFDKWLNGFRCGKETNIAQNVIASYSPTGWSFSGQFLLFVCLLFDAIRISPSKIMENLVATRVYQEKAQGNESRASHISSGLGAFDQDI